MDKKHRYIYFFDTKLLTETSARKIKTVKQATVAEALSHITNSDPIGRHYSFQKDSLHFYIADWHFDPEKEQYHILINKSDRNSANPIFSNPLKRSENNRIHRREVHKDFDEGLDHSSHIIIQLNHSDPRKCLLLLERGAIAGAHHIKVLFHRLLRDCKTIAPEFFIQNHPNGIIKNGKPETINIYYSIEIDGYISDEFQEDLQRGVFKEVVLISEEPAVQAVDSAFMTTEKTETVKLGTSKTINFSNLKALVKSKSKDFSKARVRFKHPNGTDRDIEVDTEDFNPTHYVKRAKIESIEDLKSSYIKLDSNLIGLMRKLITP
jgi:hypothetical protein